MSVQVSAGPSSLVALGFSVGDVTTLFGLARRVGNWMTAASGDRDFLDLLDQDELEILQRKGLIDILRFNKRWGSKITLLANGRPTTFTGKDAEKSLDEFSRFTAIMVCLVAALEAFLTRDGLKTVLKSALLALLQTSEFGEDVVASQFSNRLNSWRSAAEVRGLSGRARAIRQDLLKRKKVLEGFMPVGDYKLTVDFLVWLLAEKTNIFTTPSSDIAGLGFCLSELGIDVLSVKGLRKEMSTTPCRLEYSPQPTLRSNDGSPSESTLLLRAPCTTVNPKCPEESLTNFPIDVDVANRCRQAWTAGSRAADVIDWTPFYSKIWERDTYGDVFYAFYDKGSKIARTRTQIHALIEAHAFVINREICQELEFVLQHESNATLDWIQTQTTHFPSSAELVTNSEFNDTIKINAFTIFQAFIMGYYYAIFAKLVDTSQLQLHIVEGSWAYRNIEFLKVMRLEYLLRSRSEELGVIVFARQDVMNIASALMCNTSPLAAYFDRDSGGKEACVGIIGPRTLLTRSLLGPCRTLKDIGQLVVLDIDVSGIPRNRYGIVRPGVADRQKETFDEDEVPLEIVAEAPNEDLSLHVEADWDGDPDTVLLCARYKGRRAWTIDPLIADCIFCKSTFPPTFNPDPNGLSARSECMILSAEHCLNRKPTQHNNVAQPHLLEVSGMPRFCYAVAYWYDVSYELRFSGRDLESAVKGARKHNTAYLVIAGDVGLIPDTDLPPMHLEEKIKKAGIHCFTRTFGQPGPPMRAEN